MTMHDLLILSEIPHPEERNTEHGYKIEKPPTDA